MKKMGSEYRALQAHRYLCSCLAIVLLLIIPYRVVISEERIPPTSPKATVAKYLELDARGAFLTEEGRNTLQGLGLVEARLGAVSVNGPSITYVIQDYRITDSKVSGDKAVVTVEYRVIGEMVNLVAFEPRPEIHKKAIELVKKGGRWLIGTVLWPYMSWQTVVAELKADNLERSNNTIKEITETAKQAFVPGSKPEMRYSAESLIDELYRNPRFDLAAQGDELKRFLHKQSVDMLRKMRNAIFARQNYQFDDPELTEYFRKKFPSYQPTTKNFKPSEIDMRNVQYMKKMEEYAAGRDAAG